MISLSLELPLLCHLTSLSLTITHATCCKLDSTSLDLQLASVQVGWGLLLVKLCYV